MAPAAKPEMADKKCQAKSEKPVWPSGNNKSARREANASVNHITGRDRELIMDSKLDARFSI